MVTQEVRLSGGLRFKMTASIGSQLGSFGKGRSDVWESRDKLSAQRFVVDLAVYRASMQDLSGNIAALGSQFEEPLAQRLVRHQPGDRKLVQFLQILLCLLGALRLGCEPLPQGLHPRVKLLRSASDLASI